MDSDALFSNHTVVEIRAVEHKTRSVLTIFCSQMVKELNPALFFSQE